MIKCKYFYKRKQGEKNTHTSGVKLKWVFHIAFSVYSISNNMKTQVKRMCVFIDY